MMKSPYGPISDEQLREIWFRTDISLRTVAKTLQVSRGAIHYHAKRIGLPRRGSENRRKVSPEEFAEVWYAGVGVQEIADHYGYSSADTVSDKRHKQGLPPRPHGGTHRPITMKQFFARKAEDAYAKAIAAEPKKKVRK